MNSEGGYAQVNGLDLYYQIHGKGDPLVLLHGGLGAIEMFDPVLPQLAQGRQVIGVDLPGHGRTADTLRPLSYQHMGDDIAALIEHLGLARADVMGYSLGGGVALRTAIQHPHRVRKLVVVSAPCKRAAMYPEVLAGMSQLGPQAAEFMKQGPPYQLYRSIAPEPENWTTLVSKTGELLRQDYDWSSEVATLSMPVLVVAADADTYPPAHAAEFFGLLGGGQRDPGWDGSGGRPLSRLAILPGTSHYDIFSSPMLVASVLPFLQAATG